MGSHYYYIVSKSFYQTVSQLSPSIIFFLPLRIPGSTTRVLRDPPPSGSLTLRRPVLWYTRGVPSVAAQGPLQTFVHNIFIDNEPESEQVGEIPTEIYRGGNPLGVVKCFAAPIP